MGRPSASTMKSSMSSSYSSSSSEYLSSSISSSLRDSCDLTLSCLLLLSSSPSEPSNRTFAMASLSCPSCNSSSSIRFTLVNCFFLLTLMPKFSSIRSKSSSLNRSSNSSSSSSLLRFAPFSSLPLSLSSSSIGLSSIKSPNSSLILSSSSSSSSSLSTTLVLSFFNFFFSKSVNSSSSSLSSASESMN